MKISLAKRKCGLRTGRLFVVLFAAFLAGIARDAKATDWLQYGFDPGKSGVNPDEVILSRTSVAGLHQVFSHTTPSAMNGSVVFLGGVTTASGVKDLVFYSTTGGTIVAFDGHTGATVWSKTVSGFSNSTPAIDPNRQFVYHYGGDGFIHKYQVGTGTEVTDLGFPQRSLSQNSTNSLAALAIATARDGRVYLYAGGNSFDAARAGHMTVIDLRSGSQHVFNFVCSNLDLHIGAPGQPTCPQQGAGIWSRGGAAYDARVDRVYATTAEFGSFNPAAHSWSESVVAFNPDGTGDGAGNPVDSFTLSNFQARITADQDLGSNHPTVIPTIPGCLYPNMLVQVGKDWTKMSLNILNADNLNGLGHAGGTDGYILRQTMSLGGDTFSGVAAWFDPSNRGVWLIVPSGHGVAGILLTAGSDGLPKLTEQWTRASGWSTSPVVANGVVYYANGGGNPVASSGTVYAVDIATGNQLWSAPIGGHRWTSPIVVNGTLYMPLPNQVIAYSVTGPTPTPTQGTATPTATATLTATPTPTPTAVSGGIRINSGGAAASPFVADVDFVGGTAATNWTGAINTTGVTSPAPQAVYQAERYGASTYTVPGFTAGSAQTVRLHFCENYFTASGKRVFNVSINGAVALTNFDIFATSGAIHKAVVKELTASANASGQYVIQLSNVTNNALINGIEILPASATPTATATVQTTPTPTGTDVPTATATSTGTATSTPTATPSPTVTPTPTVAPSIRINSGGGAVSPFAADMDFAGGTAATNWTGAIDVSAVISPAPQSVYQAERYGASTYTVPGFTAGSSHTVRLHMCENYFTAVAKRVFNVSINGTKVLTNFDIFAATGAVHKATIQQFTATANGSGQIVIQLTNVTNNALINGVEIN